MSRFFRLMFALAALVAALWSASAWACPFCSAVSQTFSEEIATMDVAVIGRLAADPPRPVAGDPNTSFEDLGKAKFEIVEVLKGEQHLDKGRPVELLYFGDGKKGTTFLMMASDAPKLNWTTPTLLTSRSADYIRQIVKLPKDGPGRIAFFQNYLEDQEEMLARDAYDEFAKTPYASVSALKEKMPHDKLVEWIKDKDIPASRRRLYLTMLGVCGTKDDVPMLAEMLKSEDRQVKAGLDAMIACYLTLLGSDGMPLIEDLYLKNKKAEYADTYSAIMALRFHGTETDVIPRKRLLQGLHYMLDRPELADLVIVDLARWEDWSVMPRLVQLFKEADEKSSWVRVPVIRYLMACDLPEAKKYLAELEKLDPASVKRAQTFFPFGGGAAVPSSSS